VIGTRSGRRLLALAATVAGLCPALVPISHPAAAAAAGAAPRLLLTNAAEGAVWEVDTSDNQKTAGPIGVGRLPEAIAITPDGQFAYVTDLAADSSVSVVDLAQPQVARKQIKLGASAQPIAIAPDGRRAYVGDGKGLSVIDTATNSVVPVPDGEAIDVRGGVQAIAIAPDGRRVYIANAESQLVSVDTATNREVEAKPLIVGAGLSAMAITPDGRTAYAVSNLGRVAAVDLATNRVVKTIPVGAVPLGIAIAPDGRFAYVVNLGGNSVSVIETATNRVKAVPDGEAINVGNEPRGIAIAPDGRHAYVADSGANTVSVIDTASQDTVAAPIAFPSLNAFALAVTPLQGPHASFTASAGQVGPGVPVNFDASASADSDGKVLSYAWDFGDGTTQTLRGPTATHAYTAPGIYRVGLKLTDDHGCSSEPLFTGQTAYCNGSAAPRRTITVASPGSGQRLRPGVRVRCPRRARGRCRIALQAIARKPKRGRKKVKVESAVARVRLGAGRSAVVPLEPTEAFRAKLAAATKVLVRERIASQHLRRTLYRRLPVVQ
jgi:YVTN family beta-propeller protein